MKKLLTILTLIIFAVFTQNKVNAATEYKAGTIVQTGFKVNNSNTFNVNSIQSNRIAFSYFLNEYAEVTTVYVNGQDTPFTIDSSTNPATIKFNTAITETAQNEDISIAITYKIIADATINSASYSYSITLRNTDTLESDSRIGGGTGTTIQVLSYPVSYNANGGSGVAPTESNKAKNEVFTAATNSFEAPENHIFKEWNTQADGLGTSYAEGESITMPDNALTLYAIWESSDIGDNNNNNGNNNSSNNNDSDDSVDKSKKDKDDSNYTLPDTGNNNLTYFAFLILLTSILYGVTRYTKKFN